MRCLVIAFGLLACGTASGVHAPATPATLEVRFCPAAVARTYPLESQRGISALVVENVAIVNRGASVEVAAIRIDLEEGGRAVDTRWITGDELARLAGKGKKLQASGMLQAVGFQFCGTAMLAESVKLDGPTLAANTAMLLTYQTFAFQGARDAVRVTVRARSGGHEVEAGAAIPIDARTTRTAFRFPLSGVWFAGVGPTPHGAHRWGLPEQFAFDIAKIGDGDLTYRGDGTHFTDYYAYGADVLAAAAGKVVAASNDAPEDPGALRRPGEPDDAYGQRLARSQAALLARGTAAIGGNVVIIDHGNAEYSVYAHLQPGSVRVRVGDAVTIGQPIAKLGSSGNSTEPHLHFQVCDAPDPLSCAGIPIQIIGVRLPWADYPRPIQSGDIVVAE